MQNEPTWIVPLAVGLITAEYLADRKQGNKSYDWRDSLASLAISLMSIGTTFLFRGLSFVYLFRIYDHSLFIIPNQLWSWITALILADFLAYWFHWLGHHSTFFWLAHAPHHSSKNYNLSTAIRTPVFNACFRFIFWTPLCFLGFDPRMVISIESFIFIYTFFIHTEKVRKLGWIEYILNTPSHHRVHHGTNDQYIDRNFGCVFIIWDRLFGTYQEEDQRPRYGILNRNESFNPIRIVLEGWWSLVLRLWRSGNPMEAFAIIFGPPDLMKSPAPCVSASWRTYLLILVVLSSLLLLL